MKDEVKESSPSLARLSLSSLGGLKWRHRAMLRAMTLHDRAT